MAVKIISINIRRVLAIVFACCLAGYSYGITKEALADSLTRYIGFPSCVSPVKVYKLKVKAPYVTIESNAIVGSKPMTAVEVTRLRTQVSRWVLGHPNGKVTIYTDKHEIKEYILPEGLSKGNGQQDLSTRHIALWGSHGVYFHREEDCWKWQRAALWTTVEDVFSSAFSRHVVRMFENAGAVVYQPRGQVEDSAAWTIGPSGYPRWAEAARYWLEYTGVPDSIWRDTTENNDYKDDIRCRAKWVNWLSGGSKMNPDQEGLGIPIDLCLALHTDGLTAVGDSSIVGTLAIYCDHDMDNCKNLGNGQPRTINRELAHRVQTQVVEDLRRTVCPHWTRREIMNSGYYEARCPKVPSLLLEILSHIQMADMQYGLDPANQFLIARAIYKGVGRWLNGEDFVVQPLPVRAFTMCQESEGIRLSWQENIDTLESSAHPDYYIVERRINDGEWKELGRSQQTHLAFGITRGKRYDFRVIACNAGGKSYPSQLLSAYISEQPESPKVLIINAFDTIRGPQWFVDSTYAGIIPGSYAIPDGISYCYIGEQMDFTRSHVWLSNNDCGWGMCYKDRIAQAVVGNTHDYPVMHGRVLQAMNTSYISSSWEGLDTALVRQADIVDLIIGKQEQAQAIEQALAPLAHRLLVSGAYSGSIAKASICGRVKIYPDSIPEHRYTLSYPVQPNPLRLQAEQVSAFSSREGQVMARYEDTGLPAVVWNGQSVRCGLPLETLYDFDSLYKQCINLLRE